MLSSVLGLIGNKYARVALGILGVFLAGAASGYKVTHSYYVARDQRELLATIEFNKKVIENQTKIVFELTDKNDKLDNELEQLKRDAENDPHAADPCLSPDSVQRLNKIGQ